MCCFFFKQKTAYEMRSSDWSSDVCSSDLDWQANGGTIIAVERIDQPVQLAQQIADMFHLRQSEGRAKRLQSTVDTTVAAQPSRRQDIEFLFLARSEERPGGQECAHTSRSRWSPYP